MMMMMMLGFLGQFVLLEPALMQNQHPPHSLPVRFFFLLYTNSNRVAELAVVVVVVVFATAVISC
jgi:hypothetical protein